MNTIPQYLELFRSEGIEAVHWSSLGAADDVDEIIMQYALEHGFVIVTRDLDFSAMLSVSGDKQPSVVQLRAQVTMPREFGALVLSALRRAAEQLESGAVVTVTPDKVRVRLLPLPSRT